MLRTLFYRLPVSLRYWVRRAVFLPVDALESVTGKRPDLVPPKGMIFTGAGNYVQQGDTFLGYFIEYTGLRADHAVLDVGSGIGRMARPFTSFLSEKGLYEGFDVVPTGVEWCNKHISSKYPNFHFQCFDLNNDLYTDGGKDATTFKFPYSDNHFDLVFLTSVFTHMSPSEVEHYIGEIQRVLKPGGHMFSTFFVLDSVSEKSMIGTEFEFGHRYEGYALMDEKVTSANVAFEEKYLTQMIEDKGLSVTKYLPGSWSSRSNPFDFQDIIVATKI